jgi:hypothetical protein
MVATLLVYFGFSLSVTHKLNRWHVFPTKKMCMYVTPCWKYHDWENQTVAVLYNIDEA